VRRIIRKGVIHMSILDDAFRGKLWTGLAMGIGISVLAPAVMPVLSNIVKPVTKAALKGLIILRDKGAGVLALQKKTAPASEARTKQKADSAEKPKVKTFTGMVKETGPHAQTITVVKKVRGKNVETVLHIAMDAVIHKGTKKKTISDIKQGDKVVSKYTEIEGRMIAKNLAIIPGKKTAQTDKKSKKP
jgi:hypothetical protein